VREKVKIIYRQGRSIASAKDRVTQVLVTLDSKGELIKVDILSPSGVEALDAAAVEAFRAAAPFPNPPKGMVEPDGTIKIRWDFVLEA
jgi:TonB family protein